MSAGDQLSELAEAQIVAIGELLIDFVPALDAPANYTAKVGGAPANVAIMAAALGTSSLLISRVGKDWLGEQARAALSASGARTDGVLAVDGHPTGVAVVAPPGAAGPAFLMYREGSAESELRLQPQELTVLSTAEVIHLSSLLPTSAAGQAAIEQAVAVARERGIHISYDVNLRPSAWRDPKEMRRCALTMIEAASIVKITEDELDMLDLRLSPSTAGARVWLVTNGEKGARLVTSRLQAVAEAPAVHVVDTTGAGDATLAYLLHALVDSGTAHAGGIDDTNAQSIIDGAVQLGSWVVQHAGATDRLPSRGRVESCSAI
jgi:fructokinase